MSIKGTHAAFFLAAILLVAACKSSEETTAPPPPLPPPPINMADYEDFDAAPYEEEPPTTSATVEHDVPEDLLEGKVVEQVTRSGQGFRIQVYSSQDKAAAERRMNAATAWWRQQQRTGRIDEVYRGDASEPAVYLVYRQPYYRVRVGNFATRGEAQAMLRLLEAQFPDAFIAPDRVTLTR